MSKYGLTVHPEKTRLVRFQPPHVASSETEERASPGPTTFDFLGFNAHVWICGGPGWETTQVYPAGFILRFHSSNSRERRVVMKLVTSTFRSMGAL